MEKEGANLTAKKLQVIVERMLTIKISELTAGRLIEKLGFIYITPRPGHYKQEEFKKNLNEIEKKNKKKEIFFFDESRFGTHSKVDMGGLKRAQEHKLK